MKIVVDNILDMVSDFGKEAVEADLSSFSSPRNPDIEHFLKNNAIEFAEKKMSVTYIVSDEEDGNLLGYFTLANKVVEFEKGTVSKNIFKRAEKFGNYDEGEETFTVHSYLLAQFGKNYAIDGGNRVHASDLMKLVDLVIKDIQHRIGGGFIYLDVEKRVDLDKPEEKAYEKLIDLYKKTSAYAPFRERHSFRDGKDYVMMIKAI